jgi:hypothetical protein
MVAVPPVPIPLTDPIPGSTVATVVLLLLHVPPVVASFNGVEDPEQTLVAPVIDNGKGLTVTVAVIEHPDMAV